MVNVNIIVQGLHLSWFVKFQLLPISSEKPNESCLIRVVMDDNGCFDI